MGRLIMFHRDFHLSEYQMTAWPIEHSLIIGPFFLIALFAILSDIRRIYLDVWLFTDSMFTGQRDLKDAYMLPEMMRICPREVLMVKLMEAFPALAGVGVYMVVLTLYTVHDWDGRLNTILNMLAFQGILQLDEYAMLFVGGIIDDIQ